MSSMRSEACSLSKLDRVILRTVVALRIGECGMKYMTVDGKADAVLVSGRMRTNGGYKTWLSVALALVMGACFTQFSIAQLPSVLPQPTEQLTNVPVPAVTAAQLPRDAMAEANRILEQHNRDLLATVQWAIGFAAAVVVAFLGLVGFVTNRRLDQEKQLLVSSMQQHAAEISERLSAEQSAWREATSRDILEREQGLTERLEKATKAVAEKAVASLRSKISSVEYETSVVQRELAQRQAAEWEAKGVLANAVTSQFEIAKIGKRTAEQWIVSESLHEIKRLLDKGAKFDPEEVREVTGFVDSLSSDYATLVSGIKAKLV